MAKASRYDVVVVGSGFGGSISALRLAQAGKSVLVLERGKRYRPGDFPRDVTRTDEVLWRHATRRKAQGLYDVRFLSGIGTVTASGVGGGSLIYANVHVRPDANVFEDPRWPRTYRRDSLEPYFDKVARELRLNPVPPSMPLRKRDLFQRAARGMGRETFDPPVAVAFSEPPGPGRRVCQLCAECEFGCQHGAKNTMDLTYRRGRRRWGRWSWPVRSSPTWSRCGMGTASTARTWCRESGTPWRARGWCWPRGRWARWRYCCAAGTSRGRCLG
ncbi:GMC family oxidoreductase N-terminal domain-containing protein [Myxococcus sp. MxC21-1]|uniref:FAD-binding protein n=1 Tax=Myxococcus sp. MxC21-1 TaxID=3041439 RepID=UPI00292EA9AA|nr:FAD-binding protein [Myxococcus sp. MxC21-1]WNZ65755.1 GMC family oxidoreductase N-terminal domain-containing protein [Myxococcus sp. MxC21-1]